MSQFNNLRLKGNTVVFNSIYDSFTVLSVIKHIKHLAEKYSHYLQHLAASPFAILRKFFFFFINNNYDDLEIITTKRIWVVCLGHLP